MEGLIRIAHPCSLLSCLVSIKLICVITSIVLMTARGDGEYEEETWEWKIVVPKDMNDCELRYDTIYPWIVKIWDKKNNKPAGLGSLLTYDSVLSSCILYEHTGFENYKIIGQNIWNLSDPSNTCSQTAYPNEFIKHPKCEVPEATFFNFGLWILTKPFKVVDGNYPTFLCPSEPSEMLTVLHRINVVKSTTCDLQYFEPQKEHPVFETRTIVASIPLHTECIKLLCETNPADQAFSDMCDKRFRERADGTLLCMYPTLLEVITPDPDPETNSWYVGAPLVCNGTVYGISSQVKYRNAFPTAKQDFHLVTTLLRIWTWLMQMKSDNSLPLTGNTYIRDTNIPLGTLFKKPPPGYLQRYKPSEEGGPAAPRSASGLVERPSRAVSARSDAKMVSYMIAFIIIIMPRC